MSTVVVQGTRPPTWQEVALSFVPADKRTDRAGAWLNRLPLTLIVILQVALTVRLNNIIFDDEALYIGAGHDMIGLLLHGTPEHGFYGNYFSGLPVAYPLVAGALDGAGGLALVRLFSTLCAVVATCCVFLAARRLAGRRAALLAALVFSLSGSIIFTGNFATYDAPCVMLLAAAMAVAVTRHGTSSAAVVGALLTLASVTKYVGAAFIPFIVLLVLLTGSSVYPVRTAVRTVVAGLIPIVLLVGGFLLWGGPIRAGLKFTTTGRAALAPESYSFMLQMFARDIGVVTVLALGAVAVVAHRRQWILLAVMVTLFAAGAAESADQIRIHEYVSFDKHTEFAALFFAIPAGVAAEWLLTRKAKLKLVAFALVWLVLIGGLARSKAQMTGWPATQTMATTALLKNPISGNYMSFDGPANGYYTSQYPKMVWKTPYYEFNSGEATVLKAIQSHTYEGFVFCGPGITAECHKGVSISTGNDKIELRMVEVLEADPYYTRVGYYRVWPYEQSFWQVWQHLPTTTKTTESRAVVPVVPASPAVSRAPQPLLPKASATPLSGFGG